MVCKAGEDAVPEGGGQHGGPGAILRHTGEPGGAASVFGGRRLSGEPPLHVRIRGYSDRDRKAVCMEGLITPLPQNIWQVEALAEEDQEKITQNIFAVQRQKRSRS